MSTRSRSHVFIIDGTLSSLEPGRETHAGKLYRLLTEDGPRRAQSVGYHPGVQGAGLRKWWNAATGDGLNDAILAGYSAIASRYRPGDRIYLFGYSRGAYAVRSLAGLIARVGLLRQNRATERRIHRAFHFYTQPVIGEAAAAFRRTHCHDAVDIDLVGVWDTVRALGPPYPALSYLGGRVAPFHDDALGPHIRAAYQALALDEDRRAFRPVLWRDPDGVDAAARAPVEQVWFPGAHGDIGGELSGDESAAGLANLSLVWMLSRAEFHGLALPEAWRARFPCDAGAPSVGTTRGLAKLFLLRGPRRASLAAGDGQRLHESVERRAATVRGYRPYARLGDEPEARPPARARPAKPALRSNSGSKQFWAAVSLARRPNLGALGGTLAAGLAAALRAALPRRGP